METRITKFALEWRIESVSFPLLIGKRLGTCGRPDRFQGGEICYDKMKDKG